MTEVEKIRRNIETLRESMRLGWQEMAGTPTTPEERASLRKHLNWCAREILELTDRLDELDANRT